MKSLFNFLLALVISLISLSLVDKSFLPNLKHTFIYSYCDEPIHYQVGQVDTRFNLSKEEFNTDVSQAVSLWNQAEGKSLFKADPQGLLTINLVFDSRQSLNNQINNLGNQLDNLQNQVSSQENNLKPQIDQYHKHVEDFKKRLAALNKEIEDWNNKGGAPPDIYENLKKEQQNLQQEAENLNAQAKQLNLSAENYNLSVDKLNQTASTYNQTVSNLKQTLKLKPEEGLYDPQSNTVTIYFNISHNELVHTLAHELGHALGLSHNNNEKSIMYPYATSVITLSLDDKAAIKEECKTHTILDNLRVLFK